MWHGGVRVIARDEDDRLLLVCQHHEGRDIWMLPGGAIEEGENAAEAAAREMLEETGLRVSVEELIWHVEEVSPERGQRFVNYFTASIEEGHCKLGWDPELGAEGQVLREIRFMDRGEVEKLSELHPTFLKEELWDIFEQRAAGIVKPHSAFKIREKYQV